MRTMLLLALSLLVGAAVAGEVAVDDLLLPLTAADEAARTARRQVRGDTTASDDTRLGVAVVGGATAQDAVNAFVNLRLPGCRRVQFPGGFGYVALGSAVYSEHENPTATRIAKRHAYLKAYTVAKAELAKTLAGLGVVAMDEIRVALETASDGKLDLVNLREKTEENLRLATRMLLRGYVIYDVEDDAVNRQVLVSIVTTPKTRARQRRQGPGFMRVADLEAAQAELLAQVRRGVVPPVGGKMLVAADGRTVAFVGFGSAVVRHHADEVLAKKLLLEAQRQAQARADRGLVAVLNGDETAWRADLDETTRESIEEFARDVPGDDATIRALGETRKVFLTVLQQTDDWRSFSAGRLPPAVKHANFAAADGGTVYAVALYLPAARLPADQAAAEMAGAPIAADPKKTGSGDPAKRPDKNVEKGPTGRVTEDDDL